MIEIGRKAGYMPMSAIGSLADQPLLSVKLKKQPVRFQEMASRQRMTDFGVDLRLSAYGEAIRLSCRRYSG